MRFVVVTALVTSLLGWSISCVENEPPQAQAQKKPVTILSPPAQAQGTTKVKTAENKPTRAERQAQQKQALRASTAAPQVPDGAPAAPKGAQYTIFCGRVQGDAHVERANKVKGDLISRTGLSGFYVVHEDAQSLLYYGFYRAFNDAKDAKESARAQADLKRIKTLESDGNRIFAGAVFVDLEAPDPQAPPEWNLVNARGAWSLQIAAYKDSPLRKEAAVDAVREARKQGIEAYYYHGETISSVCIGAWPENAVRVNDAASKKVNPNDEILVTPPGVEASGLRRAERKDVKVINEKVEILDPAIKAAMEQYPHHAVNGMQMVKSINGQQVPDPSLLIRIPAPQQGNSILTSAPPAGQPAADRSFAREPDPASAARQQQQAPPPPQPGLGKLKSINDR